MSGKAVKKLLKSKRHNPVRVIVYESASEKMKGSNVPELSFMPNKLHLPLERNKESRTYYEMMQPTPLVRHADRTHLTNSGA